MNFHLVIQKYVTFFFYMKEKILLMFLTSKFNIQEEK